MFFVWARGMDEALKVLLSTKIKALAKAFQ